MPDFGVIWHERYVDNRFILLRDSAPSTAVLRNFLSLEFYRPPIMLETQNAAKVLGHMCDSSSRTITPQLPDHPSQIKGVRSANDQTFTCSSWSSRSWLIVRGAQSAIQQQIGLDALKRLLKPKASILISYVMSGVAGVCMHVRSWLGSGDFLHCGIFLPWSWLCTWSVAFCAPTGRYRQPARSPSTNSRISSTAMRCNCYGLVHLRNVQAHSSSRSIRATPFPRRSRVRLTPGPHGHSEDEDDWGEWTQTGLRAQDDWRRPGSPSMPPVRQVESATVDLTHLSAVIGRPSLCASLRQSD